MLGLNNRDGGVDVFRFQLAEKLGKTVGEIESMPHDEYVAWGSYFHVKATLEAMHRGT